MFKKTPLYRVLKEGGGSWSRGFRVAIGVLVVFYAILLALAVSPTVQQRMMMKFHLRTPQFGEWAVLQLVPSMYSFHNEYWFGPQARQRQELDGLRELAEAPESAVWYGRVNHYPPRISTFRGRKGFYMAPYDLYFQYRTSYQGRSYESQFRLTKRGGKLVFVDESDAL